MTLERFSIALAAASLIMASNTSVAAGQTLEEANFSCGRDRMTVQHAGVLEAQDFEPGEIVIFRKADVLASRQYRTLNAKEFGGHRLRIYLKPQGCAKEGCPDRLLLASSDIASLVRNCLIGL